MSNDTLLNLTLLNLTSPDGAYPACRGDLMQTRHAAAARILDIGVSGEPHVREKPRESTDKGPDSEATPGSELAHGEPRVKALSSDRGLSHSQFDCFRGVDQNVPLKSAPLIVMPPSRRPSNLLKGFKQPDRQPLFVSSCREARRVLHSDIPIAVVVTDVTLADGNWADVLRCVVDSDDRSSLILVTPKADERLWSEALWRGVHDILVEPFSADEARRVLEGAQRAADA